jgi:hypothetical protein
MGGLPKSSPGASRLRIKKEIEMRIMETAATSFVALCAQVLVVATIMI